MRRLGLAVALCLLPVLGHAQDRAQTLADIQAELSALAAEFNALKAELVSTGAATSGAAGGDALTRMDTIEATLRAADPRTEEVELKLNRVVTDGTNRIGDIEYRLCEVTEGCDPANLGATPTLGRRHGRRAGPRNGCRGRPCDGHDGRCGTGRGGTGRLRPGQGGARFR